MTSQETWKNYVSTSRCEWLETVAGWLAGVAAGKKRTEPTFDGWQCDLERDRSILAIEVARAQPANNPNAHEADSTILRKLAPMLPLPQLRALEREIRRRAGVRHAQVRTVASSQVAVLFVREQDGHSRGVPARLEIELLEGGTGYIFPHPAMHFVAFDPQWHESLESALMSALEKHPWPGEQTCDVQWRVLLPEDWHFALGGSSAGGAARFAFELALVPSRRNSGPSMLGVAFVTSIGDAGMLRRVDFHGLEAKLRDGMRESLPRLHTFVIADEQREGSSVILDGGGMLDAAKDRLGAKVIFSASFDDALAQVDKHLSEAWGDILDADYAGEWKRHLDLVERPLLNRPMLEQWKKCRDSREKSGGWVLMADPFFGKSAFAASWFREGRPVLPDFFVAGHFFREGSALADVKRAIRSIVLQLCQTHDIPVPPDPAESFVAVLTEAGKRALNVGRTQMIVLDGLDEMNPSGRDLLETALPARSSPLPDGVFILATTRPGGELMRLRELTGMVFQRLDPAGRTTTDEIRQILDDLNLLLPERIEAPVLDALAAACEGLLGLAFLFTVRNQENFAVDLAQWRQNPSSIPRGLAAAVRHEWTRAIRRAETSKGVFSREQVRAFVGCLALTGDVSTAELTALIAGIPADSWRDPLEKDDLKLRVFPKVAEAARILFDPAPAGLDSGLVRRRFWHSSFPQYIRGEFGDPETTDEPFLSREERQALHRVLAASSLAQWEPGNTAAADYALRSVCGHLRGAGMGAEWFRLLIETPEFLFRRGETGGMKELASDFPQYGESEKVGLSRDQAAAVDAIREVIRERGHFVESGLAGTARTEAAKKEDGE